MDSTMPQIPSNYPKIGTEFENYELTEFVAKNGQGAVYKATCFNRQSKDRMYDVAIKFYSFPSDFDDAKVAKKMKEMGAEVSSLKILRGHPNIVDILDYGKFESSELATSFGFVVMEWMNGNFINWSKDIKEKYELSLIHI